MSIGGKMKKIIIVMLSLIVSLMAKDIVVYENEYLVIDLDKNVKKLVVGNRDILNVSLLGSGSRKSLKLFGKESGNTSILLMYRDGTIENYHIYVNQNLGYVQKMINVIEPNIYLSKVGNGSTVISGEFSDPHEKSRVYSLLEHAGIDMTKLMDITDTVKINKMIRTKLYLVEIDNSRAKELGGVTGLKFFDEHTSISVNPGTAVGATFSGFLLDNSGGTTSILDPTSFSTTLKFLETKGIAKVLDDTVLISTEDKNSSFHVGGNMYIPVGMTQNSGSAPTIQLAEQEYGLRLTLSTGFLEKEGFMHINVNIRDSSVDINSAHKVELGSGISVPSFVSKNINTDIVAQSGHIIALGGRLHTEDFETNEKVPLLGDIPYLGELFKRRISGVKQNDLLFFLIPEIVDANEEIDDKHFYRDIKKSSSKMHEIFSDEGDGYEDIKPVKEMVPVAIDDSSLENVESIDDVVIIESLEGEEYEREVLDEVSEVVTVEDETSETIPEEVVEEKKFIKRSKDENYKAVNAAKIFIRSKPGDGKRVQVWAEGHKFISDEELYVDGISWIKVKKDCQVECVEVLEDLWISKKYTKSI